MLPLGVKCAFSYMSEKKEARKKMLCTLECFWKNSCRNQKIVESEK